MTSASLIIVLFVTTVVGAITGLALGTSVPEMVLALAAGFLGVVASALVRNFVMVRVAKAGPDDSGIPLVIIVFSIVASIAGSLAAHEITETLVIISTTFLGALAGLISSVLMAMLMVTYHMFPDKPGNLP
jgi:hypothetical protein